MPVLINYFRTFLKYFLCIILYNCSNGQILKQSASFPIGVAIDPKYLFDNKNYGKIVSEQFNSLTAENSFKMNRLFKDSAKYKWSIADSIAKFATTYQMRLHGHTLIYHQAVPKWIIQLKCDSLAWENLFRNYIQTVVGHFKGKVKSWDVVNEAFEEDGSLRETIWYQHLGNDYIARAFEYAHQADPAALLFYNDYGQEHKKKMSAILNMVSNFKKRRIPIDGIGLQMHISILFPIDKISEMLSEIQATTLLVHISELSVRLNNGSQANYVASTFQLNQQKQIFEKVAFFYKTIIPKRQQYGITLWNLGDKDSYVPTHCKCNDYPQMFDTLYQKKPAYYGFISGLKN